MSHGSEGSLTGAPVAEGPDLVPTSDNLSPNEDTKPFAENQIPAIKTIRVKDISSIKFTHSESQISANEIDVSKYLNIQAILDNSDSIKAPFADGKWTVYSSRRLGVTSPN